MTQQGSSLVRAVTMWTLAAALVGCGGGGDGSPTGGAAPVSVSPSAPTPAPTPTPTPAASLLPPAPFGLTTSADFPIVGWQLTSQGLHAPPLIALAEQKGTLAWSADLKTYTIALRDLGSGRLVYTFPGNNPAAFSVVQADGSTAKAHVSLFLKSASIGEIFWQTAEGGSPFVSARALFGIPLAAGNLPTSGRRVFTTDTDPQSSMVFDFGTRTVSGTVTSFDDGGAWNPVGPKERATLEPADVQLDGSFVAVITVPGAPRQGELRGRLFGSAGTELGVYWNAPVRDGFDRMFRDWRSVMHYPVCSSCTG